MALFQRTAVVILLAYVSYLLVITIWGLSGRRNALHLTEANLKSEPQGEYFAITLTKDAPVTGGRFPSTTSCYDHAHSVTEPLSARHTPHSTVSAIGGNAPRAYWRWPGNITKKAFDSAVAKEWPGCVHCMNVAHYKIVGRKLYISEKSSGDWHKSVAEEMLQVSSTTLPVCRALSNTLPAFTFTVGGLAFIPHP